MTNIPPNMVPAVGISLMNNHTHTGPRENSKSIKIVTSAAMRCLVAIINPQFARPERPAPHRKASKISFIGMLRLSP